MSDLEIVDKQLLAMLWVIRRQDGTTWCQMLKSGYDCFRVQENLSKYVRVSNSLSRNKFKAMKGTWYLYRNIEKIGLMYSIYCFIGYALNATKKNILTKNIK